MAYSSAIESENQKDQSLIKSVTSLERYYLCRKGREGMIWLSLSSEQRRRKKSSMGTRLLCSLEHTYPSVLSKFKCLVPDKGSTKNLVTFKDFFFVCCASWCWLWQVFGYQFFSQHVVRREADIPTLISYCFGRTK